MIATISSYKKVTFWLLPLILILSGCGGNNRQPVSSEANNQPIASSQPVSPASSPEVDTAVSNPTPTESPESTTSQEDTSTPRETPQSLGVKPEGKTCPDDSPIKGRKTKKRGKIYYTPDSRGYKKIKPTICFADIATAKRAGYTVPKKVKKVKPVRKPEATQSNSST